MNRWTTQFTRIGGLRYAVFLLVFSHGVGLLSGVSAEPPRNRRVSKAESLLDQARASFRRVQSQDPSVTDIVLWDRTATRFTALLEGDTEPQVRAEVFATLGDLYTQMFEKRNFQPALSKAIYFYERLAKDFQGDSRVPQRLLKLGDLRRTGLKDETAARVAYFELVDVYPKSAEARQAKVRVGDNDDSASDDGSAKNTSGAKQAYNAVPPAATEDSAPVAESAPSESKEIFRAADPIKKPVVVVIDPGHGGDELGAIGVGGVLEKDVTLAIAQLLEELLKDRLHATTVLTRRDDRTISLADRTRFANEQKADLFVSVHANASEYKTAKGVEVYYLDNTNDKSSLKLAERENASPTKSATDLAFIFSDFIQNAKLDESISLSHHIQNELVGTLGRYYHDVKNLGVKKAPFYVLVGAHMPCVLVEVSFIDHPVEGALLATKRYQRLAALGIYQGVATFFEQLRK